MNSPSTLRGVPAAVRMYTGNPEPVVCDVVVVAYRRWGYRQLRGEHRARFVELSGALADLTMLCQCDQSAADGGPMVAMQDTAPHSQRVKLTTIEKCKIALYRRKTDC